MRRGRALRSDEAGSILPLVFGFFAVGLALVLVVTAASSLYLERSRLYTLADGAALAGADAFRVDAARLSDDGEVEPQLDDAAVDAAAAAYLSEATLGRRNPVALVGAGSPDGRSATVRLAENWRPPLLSAFVPHGVRIEVTGRARPVFW